ncbi:alpha/beta fold hydrolase [Rhodococcus sp. NPDC047139]|uniref:alpha/beta fold hydrolase n=1 Tax=Rhodococcus sp. NPDC047139 TaxID=3155141 RepID=UPI00340358AE
MSTARTQSSPIEEAHVGGAGDVSPVARVVDVEGIPMSALVAEAAEPRAVIVALHGGAARAAYWDCPGHPELSMMREAVAHGFTVIAPDRPGYGSSRPHREELGAPARRVHLACRTVDALLGASPRGAGLFLWGHSVGSELTVRMAVENPGEEVLGMELSGTGREHHALAAGILGTRERYANARGVGELLWTPSELYPPDIVGGAAIAARTPDYEADVTAAWPTSDFPALAAQVRVPVHFTAAEHEKVWRNDAQALEDIAEIFSAAPTVTTYLHPGGGHNLSIGYAGPAYHRTVFEFVDDCIAQQETPAL